MAVNRETAFAHDEACYPPPRESPGRIVSPETVPARFRHFVCGGGNVRGRAQEGTRFKFFSSPFRSAPTDSLTPKPPLGSRIRQRQASPARRGQRRTDQRHRTETPGAFWTHGYSRQLNVTGPPPNQRRLQQRRYRA